MAAPHRELRPKSLRAREAASTELRDLPLDGEGALYEQIYRAIREAILGGRVRGGTRLPTTRALAAELGVSRNTVIAAFEPLQAEGYVASRVGAGTFVVPQVGSQVASGRSVIVERGAPATESDAEEGPPLKLSRYGQGLATNTPRRLYDAFLERTPLAQDFRPCVPDVERLPYEDWRRHLARTAHHLPNSGFEYADPAGVEGLRVEIADYLARARGVLCDADQIVVVGGVAQALDLAARLFVDPGDAVLVEDPHYLGARRTFEAAGAEIVGAPVDQEGMDPRRVSSSDRKRCRMAYVTPSHQFPTGVILSLARRQALLNWAEEANAYILEDDYDSEFRYAGRAIPSLKSLDERGRVLYVGTFSKTLLPALRIAYLVLPKNLVELFRSAKWLSDWAAPSFEQHALARFLGSGDFERHLRRARTLYARSRVALIEALAANFDRDALTYHDSQAGLHLLVRFRGIPRDCQGEVVRCAEALGIGVYPAAPCYLDPACQSELELVLGFARLEPEMIRVGIEQLATVLSDSQKPGA